MAPLILLFIKGHVLQYYENIKKRSFSALQCDHIVVKMSYEEGIDNNKVKEFSNTSSPDLPYSLNNTKRVTNYIVQYQY